jgi:hypothetical protein
MSQIRKKHSDACSNGAFTEKMSEMRKKQRSLRSDAARRKAAFKEKMSQI